MNPITLQAADDFLLSLGVTDIVGYEEVGRGPSWTVLAPVLTYRNMDAPFVVVEDGSLACHVENVPTGRWFTDLSPAE